MIPQFRLYFKTMALLDFIEPELDQLPEFFEFQSIEIGVPPIQRLDPTDPVISDFPFPIIEGDVYVFDDDITAHAVGLASYLRASVRVRPEDTLDVVLMRLWHELLHAVGQPADDMASFLDDWATPFEHVLWVIWPWFMGSRDVPFWHRRFYRWLTTCAEARWG